MELQQPERINELEIIREYQTPLSRRKRFFDYSDADGWYLETMDGGYKMPNRFCAITDTKILSNYFLFKRIENERFKAYEISTRVDGSTFILRMSEGLIWENYQNIESNCGRAQYFDADTTLKNLQETIKSLFTNFTITI